MHGIYACRSWRTAQPRILLVDDEQPIQTLLSFPLQRDGYEVVQASDGREALARFAEQTFDLVVLDVMLPEDGRPGGVPPAARARARPDHHAHREVRGDRQGARARARRRRLHHQAVLDARVPLAREGGAAARRDGAADDGDEGPIEAPACGSIRPSAPSAARRAGRRRRSSSSRSSPRSRAARAASTRATCCSRACGATPPTATRARSTSTSATCARSSRPTPRSRSTSSPCAASATASGHDEE